MFLVSEGRVSRFIINTDGFHTLTDPSKQRLNLGLFFTSPVFQLVVLFFFTELMCLQWMLIYRASRQHMKISSKTLHSGLPNLCKIDFSNLLKTHLDM